MKVAEKYRKVQEPFLRIALHLGSILVKPTIYDEAYPRKLLTGVSGNPVGVMETSLFFYEQLEGNSLEESAV